MVSEIPFPVMMIMQFEIFPSFFKECIKNRVEHGLRSQYFPVQLEQAFHIWYYGTRIELAYFELAAALATKTIRLMTVSEELVRTAKKTDRVRTN